MKKIIIFITVVFLFNSCKHENCSNKLTVLYQNDKQGKTINGSKNNVINAIRRGADIKIGWHSAGKTRKI